MLGKEKLTGCVYAIKLLRKDVILAKVSYLYSAIGIYLVLISYTMFF